MDKSSSISINLIKDRNQNFFDKFIKWALTIGRLIVILTESIALATFLYRFSLDRELIDLHDKINQKQAMLKLLKNNEDKYRNLQNKLAIASNLSDQSLSKTTLFNYIITSLPNDLILNSLIISNDYVKIEAKVPSISSLAMIVNSLKTNESINSVSLDRIENKTSEAIITVGITAMLKK